MPFDPKLVHAEEPPLAADGEIKLEGDLAALSEQLRDDAAHLAATYPADPEKQRKLPATLPRQKQLAAAAAAIGSVLAVLLLLLGNLQQKLGILQQNSTPNAAPPPAAYVSTAVPYSTTVSLSELSSPELEALVDLIHRQPETATNVSF